MLLVPELLRFTSPDDQSSFQLASPESVHMQSNDGFTVLFKFWRRSLVSPTPVGEPQIESILSLHSAYGTFQIHLSLVGTLLSQYSARWQYRLEITHDGNVYQHTTDLAEWYLYKSRTVFVTFQPSANSLTIEEVSNTGSTVLSPVTGDTTAMLSAVRTLSRCMQVSL
jgi:hypothetical protein